MTDADRRVFPLLLLTFSILPPLGATRPAAAAPGPAFTLEQVKSYPFPGELAAAATGSRIAWTLDERGVRNVYVAEAPAWKARRLTRYEKDDGQELTSLQLSADGRYLVYVRGGDYGSNWDESLPVNPAAAAEPTSVGVWALQYDGGEPKLLGEGDHPAVSPRGDVVAFVKEQQVWSAPIDGSAEAKKLFTARGDNGGITWSPDGSRLAFVSLRAAHALVGVYQDAATPIVWMAPSTSRDSSPRFSPDGKRLVFVRRPGTGGAPPLLLEPRHQPWSLWTADVATGAGALLWTAPRRCAARSRPRTARPTCTGPPGTASSFLSYQDGWPHLYSVPAAGGTPNAADAGRVHGRAHALAPDRRSLVYNANSGADRDDIERRTSCRSRSTSRSPRSLTPGRGLEWSPVVTGDGQWVAYLGSERAAPPLTMRASRAPAGPARALAEEQLPADFPTAALVTPEP